MRISYRLPLEYSEPIDHTATLSSHRLDIAAFFFNVDNVLPATCARISGRKATFSHLPGYVFIMHKTPSGSYRLTEESTGANCAEIDFAKNYENAFDRLMDTIFVSDVLGNYERFETARSEYLSRISERVRHLTDDPGMYLWGKRCDYRRERRERKHCMQVAH